MAVKPTRTYAPNYMKPEGPLHPWTIWFRAARLEHFATMEDFARAAGMSTRTAYTYRQGTIPRRKAQIEKIARAFDGDVGPLPGSERAVDLEERVSRLEIATIAMRADAADVFRAILDRLNDPDVSDRDRALAQEDLNEAVQVMEPTPDELQRLTADAQARAAEASDESDDEQPGDDAPPRRSG